MKPITVRLPLGDNPPSAKLYYGLDVIKGLQLLADASVHVVCTSPPYWGLRDYGVGKDQIGSEPTPEEYIARLVDVFREVARVLRPDGTLWLNLGDCYTSGGRVGHGTRVGYKQQTNRGMCGKNDPVRPPQPKKLKPKDLVGIPWRVALALQAAGWYLRSDIIWHKRNPMPNSVRDRPTSAHEYVFLLAHPDSRGRYFYDSDAVKEKAVMKPQRRTRGNPRRMSGLRHADTFTTTKGRDEPDLDFRTRNRRDVWTLATKPYRGAHFAVWPPDLVVPMVRAGTSEKGVCGVCGAPWTREVGTPDPEETVAALSGNPDRHDGRGDLTSKWQGTCSWRQGCTCEAEVVRATVLDPFSGSGTTGMVALSEDRDYIGLDISLEYLPIAKARILRHPIAEPSSKEEGDVLDLFGV